MGTLMRISIPHDNNNFKFKSFMNRKVVCESKLYSVAAAINTVIVLLRNFVDSDIFTSCDDAKQHRRCQSPLNLETKLSNFPR